MIKYASLEDAKLVVSATEWLWRQWLPRGHVTLLVGAPGDGKSALAMAIGDLLLKRAPWPDGQENKGAEKIMWLDTEGTQAVLVERATLAETPLARVLLPSAEPLADFALDSDDRLLELRTALLNTDAGFLVVDTLRGAHSAEENSSKDTAHIMKSLQIISRDARVACLVVHHTRKLSEDAEDSGLTIDRVRGSNAIVANARVVWGIESTRTEGLKRLMVIKSNLAGKPEPIGFRVDEDGLSWMKLDHDDRDTRELDRAMAFLHSWLNAGAAPADAVKEAAQAEGHSLSTLQRAKKRMGVKSERERTLNGKWNWRMP